MLTTFIPLIVGWGVIAPFLGVYDLARVADWRQLWRPFWAMVLAGPMVGWLRGVWLGQVILPIFVVVLGGISALAILAWRAIFWLVTSKMK
jgi:ABC-type xylose transport system permease subunit